MNKEKIPESAKEVFRERTKKVLVEPEENDIEVEKVITGPKGTFQADVVVKPDFLFSDLYTSDMKRQDVQSVQIENPSTLGFVVPEDKLTSNEKEKLKEVM